MLQQHDFIMLATEKIAFLDPFECDHCITFGTHHVLVQTPDCCWQAPVLRCADNHPFSASCSEKLTFFVNFLIAYAAHRAFQLTQGVLQKFTDLETAK